MPIVFVSKFHICGQRKVELARQLRISVAPDRQHIFVFAGGFLVICGFIIIPELSVTASMCLMADFLKR
jgi:hypothetical protein